MSSVSAVDATIEQNLRIYEALHGAGLPAELVRNPNDEPIAVLSRNIIDPTRVLGSVLLSQAIFGPNSLDASCEARDVLPIAGANVYPKEFLDVIDLIAVAAAQKEGLATKLISPTRGDHDFYTKFGDSLLELHADFPGSTSYTEAGLDLHGLNIHYTRWGSSVVRLGLHRSLEDDQEIVALESLIAKDESLRPRLVEAYERLAAPLTEPITLNSGDMLVFQAQQHTERGLVPVAHHFITISETRRSDTYHPHLGEVATVQAKRNELAERYQLADMGYLAQAA